MLRLIAFSPIAIAAFLTSSADAFAQGMSVRAWNGSWRSAKDISPAIELKLKNDRFEAICLDGNERPVLDVQVSPDEKTVIFSWEGGQGTLLRTNEAAAEISLFAPRLNVRNTPVTRVQ